jgi:GDP-4-dehydro-6-deoxy-D-mannose reductase
MRVLVTGAGGFVGRYMVAELARNGHEAFAFDVPSSAPVKDAVASLHGDLCNPSDVNGAFTSSKCDACIHLGAISSVPAGQSNPTVMFSVNVLGTLNVLEAVRNCRPSARILVVSTAHVYGTAAGRGVVTEDAPLAPVSMYAISKCAADLATLAYARQYRMFGMTVRPNNHAGPRQSPDFFIASFASQIKAIAAGRSKAVLKVGNLESRRDVMDVRDVVRAYRLLLEKGRAGETYNMASQNVLAVREVLDRLCELAGVHPQIVVDPAKFRPTDSSPALDIAKVKSHTGWTPQIGITDTLKDILAEA